jgi:Ca2+-binding EF-hand superfamily protein
MLSISTCLKLLLTGNGKIEYKEFEQMMASQYGSPMPVDDMKFYFRNFDKNGDGFIGADEMRCLVKAYHSHLTGAAFENQVKSMIETADTNKDGKISYEGKLLD